ncbi:MAG: hypothetical protein ACI9A7_000815 [Cyclobacteriaceae bacterium]|jgi:hypothetical protein
MRYTCFQNNHLLDVIIPWTVPIFQTEQALIANILNQTHPLDKR